MWVTQCVHRQHHANVVGCHIAGCKHVVDIGSGERVGVAFRIDRQQRVGNALGIGSEQCVR
jgi:hypothetical protein